ncbi:hypothetical protein TERMP_02216 (plasmid) [Thermococcus barophilus MP]|uniref:Uncharacterized protein n=1 Tax=Thermococcus barophilus (strain DSM 11836 / MP) TaxID=391623 RepID=F0LN50_THEBM|nr:hypothetical protein TERMP_02216 [Thermococcus barophilus MP]
MIYLHPLRMEVSVLKRILSERNIITIMGNRTTGDSSQLAYIQYHFGDIKR